MIDRTMLQNFRQDFADAVKGLEQKYGVIIELGSITYSSISFKGKLEVHEGASKDDVNAQEFKKYCRRYGLSEDDYDRRFTYKGEDYIIIGIKPSKRTYPIVCQHALNGQSYGFTPDTVKGCLK